MLIDKVQYFHESKVKSGVNGITSNDKLLDKNGKLINFSGKVITVSKTIKTYKEGKFHSYNDEPAIVFHTGSRIWYLNGVKTRIGGPAEIYSDGRIRWYLDDDLLSYNSYIERISNYITEEEKLLILMKYT